MIVKQDIKRKLEESRPEESGFRYTQQFQSQFEEREQSQFSAPTGRKITALGNALGMNVNINLISPNVNLVHSEKFAWGKKENVEYRSIEKLEDGSWKTEESLQSQLSERKENSRSKHPSAFGISPKWRIEKREQSRFSAPTGRKITARGNALGMNVNINLIAPHVNIVHSNKFAWGKKENVEHRSIEKLKVRRRKTEESLQSQLSERKKNSRSKHPSAFGISPKWRIEKREQSQFSVILKMEEQRFLSEALQFLPGETRFPVSEEQFPLESNSFHWSEVQTLKLEDQRSKTEERFSNTKTKSSQLVARSFLKQLNNSILQRKGDNYKNIYLN